MLKAGASLPRDAIEERIYAHARRRGETYRIRWDDPGRATDARLATRGVPFQAPLLDGGTYDLGAALGARPVVLVFWASWCEPCLEEAPHLARIYRANAARGLEMVAVSIDDAADHGELRRVIARLALPYPVVVDPEGKVLAQYARETGIPLTFVIDRDGAVVHAHRNYQPGDEVALKRAIAGALGPGVQSP